MSRSWRVIAALLAILLTVYFLVVAFKSLDVVEARNALSSGPVLAALVAAAVLYACIVPITGWAWSVLLSSRGESWKPSLLMAVLGLAQLAKYIPGNVAQHAARAAIAVKQGMKPSSLVTTVAQETVLAVAASVLVGVLALAATGRGLTYLGPEYAKPIMFVGCVAMVSLVLFSLSVKRSSAKRIGPVRKALLLLTEGPGWRAAMTAMASYSANYLLIGAGFWLVAQTLDGSGGLSYFMVTAAFSLSWVLGFMTPGAPAGLGAREGVMLLLLQGAAPMETTVTFVLLARIATILGDGIGFLVGVVLHAFVNARGAK